MVLASPAARPPWARARPRSARCAFPPPPRRRRAGAVRARPRRRRRACRSPAGARPRCCRRRAASTWSGSLGRGRTRRPRSARAPPGGRWTRWTPLPHTHAGDPDRTDPVFTGTADEFQFRLRGDARASARGSCARSRTRRAPRPRGRAPGERARDRPARRLGRATGPAARRPELRRRPGRVRPPHGRHDRLRARGVAGRSCSASPATTATPTAGTTSVTTSSSTATATIFEGRAGGIEAAVVGAQAQGYNSYTTGIACLGTFTDLPLDDAGDGVARAADRLEALAPRRARARPGDADLRRRLEQPLPERDAGRLRAHQRPPRRQPDDLPRRRALRAAARPAHPRRPLRGDRRQRVTVKAASQQGASPSASPASLRFADGSSPGRRAARRRVHDRGLGLDADRPRPTRPRRRLGDERRRSPPAARCAPCSRGDATRPRLESAPVTSRSCRAWR